MPMSINRTDPQRPNRTETAQASPQTAAAPADKQVKSPDTPNKPLPSVKTSDQYTQAGKPGTPTAPQATPLKTSAVDKNQFMNQTVPLGATAPKPATNVATAATQALQTVQDVGAKLGLTKPEDLKKLEPAMGDLGKAFEAAKNGNPQDAVKALGDAVGKLPEDLKNGVKTMVAEEILKNPTAKDLLGKVGIAKAEDLVKAGDAVPKLIDAGQALTATPPDLGKAFGSLNEAYKALPDSVKDTMKQAIAGKIMENPTAKDLLSKVGIDNAQDLVKAGEAIPKLVEAGQAFAGGDAVKGFQAIGDAIKGLPDDMKNKLVGKAVDAAPQQVKDLINKMGFTGADLANMAGTALPAIAKAADAIKNGNAGEALKALGDGVNNLSPELKGKILNGVVDALPVSQTMKDMIKGAGEVILDPKVRDQFTGALDKLKQSPPDIGGFVGNLSQVAQTIAKDHPQAATGFLNAMGKLGGPVGKFFNNPELNKAMVESGSVEKFFGAVEKLTKGDILGSLQTMGDAMGSLAGYGEKAKIDGPFGMFSVELPFSVDGLKAIGQMFDRFQDIMPKGVKDAITSKLATLGIGSIPVIGDIVNIGSAAKDVFDAIGKGDGLEIGLAAAKLGSSAAGVLQISKPITQALNAGIAVAQVVKTFSDAKETIDELKNAFTGL